MLTVQFFRALPAMLAGIGLAMTIGLATASAGTRTVETAFGPVSISGQPERVVTLYEGALDAAVATGVSPQGAVITRGGTTVAGYIQPRVEGIRIVGAPGETNIEAVLALRPDLILAAPYTSEEQFRILSRIAPTVVPDVPAFQPDSWIRETQLYGEALGREAEAEAAIAKVQARMDEVQGLLAQGLAQQGSDAALVRWMPQGAMLMSRHLFSANVIRAAGFDLQDGGVVAEGRPHSRPLSHENLELIDRSWVFLATLNSDGEEALLSARRAPAFGRLQAVRSDRVVHVDGQLWTSASGPLAALAILDQIQQTLAPRMTAGTSE